MSAPDKQSRQPWLTCQPTGPLLRPSDVISRTGLSRSQIYQMIREARFPPFIKLSTRASAMPEAWLQAFIDLRAKESLQRRARTELPSVSSKRGSDARTTGEQK